MKKFLAVVVTVCSITGFLVSGVSAYAMSTKDTGVKDETGVEIKVPSTYKLVSDGAYETPNGAISVTVDKVAILNGDNLDADCVKQVLDTYGDTVTFDKINQNGNAFYTVGLMKYKNIGNIVILAKFWNIGSNVYREQIVGGNITDCTKVYLTIQSTTWGTSAKARKTSSGFIAQGRVDPVTR